MDATTYPVSKELGSNKAFKYISESNGDIEMAISRMSLKGLDVPSDYSVNFSKAFLTFYFQIVYWPLQKKLRYLNDPQDTFHLDSFNEEEDKSFLGTFIDEKLFESVVKGNIDPITHKPLRLDLTTELEIHKVAKIRSKSNIFDFWWILYRYRIKKLKEYHYN